MIAIGFEEETVALASPFVAICFYYLPLIFYSDIFSCTLTVQKPILLQQHFQLQLLNLSLISALLLSQNLESRDIVYYLSWGVVIGGVLQVLVHLYAIKKLKIKFFTTNIKKKKRDIKQSKFYKQFYPAVFGSSASHVAAFLDTWLASFFDYGKY